MDESQEKPKNNSKPDREGRRVYWRRQIELALKSKMPISRYCREHGISLPSFNYWRKALKEQTPESASRAKGFVRVKVSEEVPQGIRLELGRGVFLSFDREPRVDWVKALVLSLREIPS